MKLAIAVLACLAACKGERKPPIDAAPPAPATSSFGGIDPMQVLDAVRGALGTPGPYEPPAHSDGYDADQPHWVVMHLSGTVTEVDSMSLLGGGGIELRRLTDRLDGLGHDDKVSGLVLRVDGLSISLTDAVELRAAIARVRAAGKPVRCHTESADNGDYLVLAACDDIALAPGGELLISGPAAMPIHLKGLLDKLGITADFLHVGAYKGAAEPLTRDAPSDQMKETLDAILDQAYATMVDAIAAGRKLTPDQVKAAIDQAMFSPEQATAAHLVDRTEAWDAYRDESTKGAAWARVSLEGDDDSFAKMAKAARFLGIMGTSRPGGAHVALVDAVGDVVDGSGDGMLGARTEIASGALVPALETLAADDDVKAVVLRIDSPGGSARAAELIWEAVSALAAKKPVIVSMSDVAASGGYYIASPATKIFALDDTLTGSIGVVGGKLAPAQGLAQLGITAYPMGRGKRATMMRSLGPWSADERAAVQASMDDVYKTFVHRVATGRKKTDAEIDAIAGGRVWTGAKAKALGLIDQLGTLDDAIAEARTEGGVAADTALEIYPPTPTLRDYLVKLGAVQLPWGMSSTFAQLATELSPELAAVVEHTLAQLVSFRDAQIQCVLLAPVVVR